MRRKYSIGLDIGVSSVGWACMTNEFRIPKYNGRYAIGVREFESAETAESRRLQRGTRRRYNRRIRRIQLLQQILSPLFRNDPGFFMKTDEREKHFWRNSNQFERNSLSETLKRLGKNTRKYPTIYHLRHALIQQDEKQFHPRLIYLALHNLVKFRGHFLSEHMSWANSSNHDPLSMKIYKYFKELGNHFYDVEQITEEKVNDVMKIMEKSDITNADKRTNILKVIGRDFRQPVTLLLGLRANVSQLFPYSDHIQLYKEENLRIELGGEDPEETKEKLTDEEKIVIELAQMIYQEVSLQELLGQAQYVSEAKVYSYQQFGKDLKVLKQIYNDYFGEKAYRDMFITPRKNQTEYKQTRKKNLLCTFDQFLKFHKSEDKFYRDLKKNLQTLLEKDLQDSEKNTIMEIIEKINMRQFLQKQKGRHNAAIPHQNNLYEAEKILRNQQKFYPEITDEMIEKVKKIISFRIPYYVGPLVKDRKTARFGWAVRKSDKRILPWTIDEVIDHSASAEAFIKQMTSFCAYLTNEKVLPKHSLTYEMFEVLNELNGIQIRPYNEMPNRKYRLGPEVKKWIIEHVFQRYKNVTHKRLISELKKSPYKEIVLDQNNGRTNEIYGTQKEDQFGTSLSSYIDMKRIFGDVNKENKNMLEDIIYWISVFEEKDILELKVKEKYPSVTKDQIRLIQNLNYTGWGRLSRRLIDELIVDTSKNRTLLDIMKQDTVVFMEVLSLDKYNLKERIAKMNKTDQKQMTKITYKDIEQLQGSPAIKKGIWQAILIIEELVNIFGEPEHIMIEFAKEDGEDGKRFSSRKKEIRELQRAVSKDEKELKDFLKEHSQYDEKKYRNNRLYLYITQGGKCLYSGESLDITRLSEYEVDHIYPRSFVKDDSIDNLALVKQHMNQAKGNDKMPLEVIEENAKFKLKMFWKKLFDNKLISQTKYFRLLKESFSDQDKESFFARQLVETRQITRHVRDLLNERFEHTKIHPVNANIVANLRKHSGILKIRDLNNKHHAVDAAFTNLIVQFILKKYGYNFLNFNFKYQEAHKKWRKMITKYRKNFFLFADIDEYNKFTHYKTGELLSGREFLTMINDEIPWQTTKKVGSGEAAFYDETIYSPRETKGKNPQYESSKLNKGVHSGVKVDSSYIISYKFLNTKQQERTTSDIVNLFVIEKYQTRSYTEKQLAFFLARKVARGKVIDATIHTRLLKHQLILLDNHPLYFVSAGEMNNAKQFRPDQDTLHMLYKIVRKEEESVEYLKEAFAKLAQNAIDQYKVYLPESRIKNIKDYIQKIKDLDTFKYGVNELFKMAGASASRSEIFGGRYERKLNPQRAQFIHQSITGLYYRKPKSFKNELWST